MNGDHVHAFVAESRESITNLNNALLALEDDPTDDEAMDSVFRTAHTLKGNFGAMGFSNASELTHVLEDLLDEIRAGEIDVTPEIMDAVFDGVDRIETIVDEIDRDGDSTTDPDETTARLRSAIERGAAAPSTDSEEIGTDEESTGSVPESGPDSDSDSESESASDSESAEREPRDAGITFVHADEPPMLDDADDLVHARVEVNPDGMLGVDAMLILKPLSDAVSGLSTAPTRDRLEEGRYDGRFDVFVPETDSTALTETLEGTGSVESFEVSEQSVGSTSAEYPYDPGKAVDGGTEGGTGDGMTKNATGGDISSVRVDVGRLDELHGLVEQLVTGRITIRQAIETEDLETAESSLNDLDQVTSRLQNTVMDMRMIPLRRVMSNLPRVVRDVARSQRKDVDFEMYGEDIELHRSILTEIEDPLIHILRNAVDHGIESPDEREAAGKPREGTIKLRASSQRDHVTIAVSDDGGGIDPDAMRTKAIEEGVLSETEAETMLDEEAYGLIFHPGFSTATEVTDVSGRGVGMDVVHRTVEQLDGTVNVDSALGEGTTVELRFPVSVAIVNVLFVGVGDREYGIPIKNIDE